MELIQELQALFDKTYKQLSKLTQTPSAKVDNSARTNLAKFTVLLRLSILGHPHEPNPNLKRTLVLWSEFCAKGLNNFRWDTVVHFTVSPNNMLLTLPDNLPELENYDLGYIDYYKYLGARLSPLPYPDNANKFDELLDVDLEVEDFRVAVKYSNNNLQIYSSYADDNYRFLREYTSPDILFVNYSEPESYSKALKNLSSSLGYNYREISTTWLYNRLSCLVRHRIVEEVYRTCVELRLISSEGTALKVFVGVYELAKVIKLFVNTTNSFAYFNLYTDIYSKTFVTVSTNRKVEDSKMVAVLPTLDGLEKDYFKTYLKHI